MPQEQENFRKAVQKILEVVMFENWLRFYFIAETETGIESGMPEGEECKKDELRIELPPKALEKIRELHPGLFPLAAGLNGQPVDFETSRRAVLLHVLNELDNRELPRGMPERIFSSAAFQIELQLFNTWEQTHETQLEHHFLDFSSWQALFSRWKEQPGARELAASLSRGGKGAA